ncbi:hypothetical protein [Nocardia sp. NPDC057668]|uniref:hypothetical protein n=1 Tax=Nocardia sp. NPDC057668 TaxID=3346202 RepID=UPI0036708BC7
MSAPRERSALEHPDSLFDHITALHLRSPDSPLPKSGDPRMDALEHQVRERGSRTGPQSRAAVSEILTTFFAGPDQSLPRLHDALADPEIEISALRFTRRLIPLPAVGAPAPARAREVGAWLVRHGRDPRPVLVGLRLLESCAAPADIPLLRTMALLPWCAERAISILGTVPGAAFDLVWLGERTRRRERILVMNALVKQADPAARQWLLRNAFIAEGPGGSVQAREIARVTRLSDALAEDGRDDRLRDQALAIMVQLISHRDYRTEIENYPDARRVLALLADDLPAMEPSLPRMGAFAALIQDMRTGAAAGLEWQRGERESLLERMRTGLSSEPWESCLRGALEWARERNHEHTLWRARWIRDQLAAPPVPRVRADLREGQSRFEIRIVSPALPGRDVCGNTEVRVLVDGHPVIATAFPHGHSEPPENLLEGQLRATGERRRVRLAAAYSTEGSGGALYVTIVREDDEVLWCEWDNTGEGDPPPEMRFPASEYDRELDLAERNTDWEWPARTLSRLLLRGLRADPGILERWNCSISWISAWVQDLDRARVYLFSTTEPQPRQFGFTVRADPADPEAQARALLESFRATDPREVSRSHGGTTPPAPK